MEMSEFNENKKIEFSERLNLALDKLEVPIRARAQWVRERLSFEISVNGIKKWLEGESLPSSARYDEIATVCKVSPMWLMSGKESESFSEKDFDAHLKAILRIADSMDDADAKTNCMKAIHQLSQR